MYSGPSSSAIRSFVQRTYYVNNVFHVRVYRPYALPRCHPERLHSGPLLLAGILRMGVLSMALACSLRLGLGKLTVGMGTTEATSGLTRSTASPVFWLTDFFMAATLEEAYREREAAAADARNNALLNRLSLP